MQFDANLAPARVNPVPGQGGSVASEIDLYDDLLAFVELSPDEQRRYLANLDSASEAPKASQPIPASTASEAVEKVDPEIEALVVDIDSVPSPENVESIQTVVDASDIGEPLNEGLEAAQPVVGFSGATDPLVDLNLDNGFTGELCGKDCLACGARSADDDLFCMRCGSFLNGVASNSPSDNPVCSDCSQPITIDEIFCPWCGSVLAGN